MSLTKWIEENANKKLSNDGLLSHFRYYDIALMAANPIIGAQVIAGREVNDAIDLGTASVFEADGTGKAAPPPPAPDFTDEQIRKSAMSEAEWIKSRRGRRSTFLTGQSASSTMFGG